MNQHLSLYLSTDHPCSYLPGNTACSIFITPDQGLNAPIYSSLATQGFRRSGDLAYRPHCSQCHACIPVRVPVNQFRPNRSQRRTLQKNVDLVVSAHPPLYVEEHYLLFLRYIAARHDESEMLNSNPGDYIDFLASTWCETVFYEFRCAGELVAVAVVDWLHDAWSAVYTFYAPELPERSLGTYAVLWQLGEAQRQGLHWLYLGYWIKNCRKMAYKQRFRPLQAYHNGEWITLPIHDLVYHHTQTVSGGAMPNSGKSSNCVSTTEKVPS